MDGGKFRFAKEGDLPSLIQLLQDDVLGATREEAGVQVSYEAAWKAIQADSHHEILVFEREGQVLACAQISFLPNLTFQGAWRAQIEGVRVQKDLRGQGLGRQFLKKLIDIARERDCKIVQLTSNKSRTEALSFYNSLGFEASHEGFKIYL